MSEMAVESKPGIAPAAPVAVKAVNRPALKEEVAELADWLTKEAFAAAREEARRLWPGSRTTS